MFGTSPAIILILTEMGSYLQAALKRAALDAASGVRPDPDALGAWLFAEMAEWSPKIKGRPIADPETRRAAARLLAGLACNLITPGASNERAA